jgi:hypothetical protein
MVIRQTRGAGVLGQQWAVDRATAIRLRGRGVIGRLNRPRATSPHLY